MQVAVLGPVTAVRDGSPVALGAPKQRSLLAALALHGGRAVPPDTLVDLLWGDDAPPAAGASLQTYVAGLRRALEPGRAARSASAVLPATAQGYALILSGDDALDAARFTATVERVHRRLARAPGKLPQPADLDAGEAADLREQLDAVLADWRGTPFADLRESDAVRAERARLDDLRLVALEDRALLRLALGEHAAVAAELEQVVREHPLRESLRGVHVLALARSGRQSDALAALRDVRSVLAEDLGIEPGPGLQALETAVLRQSADVAPPVPAPGEPASARPTLDPGEWPFVGRRDELAALDGVLAAAASGRPGVALVTGEPGVGKSRLLRELSSRAAARGFAVATGRASRDDGAPPLWPWTSLLRDLGAALPTVAVGETARFDVWEAVAAELAAAAATRPLLAVLDDLHWADVSSLKLLTHVVDTVHTGSVALVVTRRTRPEPAGALAELGEALARRGAVRVDLAGLPTADVAALAGAAGGRVPDDDEARALRERTGGNPFFVGELVRLDPEGAGSGVPAAVTDVVASRVDALPGGTRRELRTASVIGPRFGLRLLATVSGADEDAVLADLEAAVAEGILAEDGAETFRFSHDLVHDAVLAAVPATRRARRHADVAAAVEASPGHSAAEAARHWLAAGPAHAAKAWRAAITGAREAHAVHAWDEWAALLAAAVTAQRGDAGATPRERYDLLVERANACRRVADRTGLEAATAAAIDVAEGIGDVELVARAAVGPADLSLWHHRGHGGVNQAAIRKLREILRRLPPDDTELRCRVMLALANELRFADAPLEREALVEQGLEVARRRRDPALIVWACNAGCTALWRPATAEGRHGLALEALAAAPGTGDVEHEVVAHTLAATTAQETGRLDVMRREIALARALAEPAGLVSPLVVLGWLEIPWLALEGRFETAERLFGETLARWGRTSMPQHSETPAGTALAIRMAAGLVDLAAVEALEAATRESALPMEAPLLVVMLRAGLEDRARQRYAAAGVDLDHDTWYSLQYHCLAGEAAFRLGERDLGARVFARLAPYTGRPCSAGAAVALGPVDAFLAMASWAAGEADAAEHYAAAALALAEAWRIPAFTAWFRGVWAEREALRPRGQR